MHDAAAREGMRDGARWPFYLFYVGSLLQALVPSGASCQNVRIPFTRHLLLITFSFKFCGFCSFC